MKKLLFGCEQTFNLKYNIGMDQIIEIEFKSDDISGAKDLAVTHQVNYEVRGTHPDGLTTIRFTGHQNVLENFLQDVFPDEQDIEFEAYMIV
jgi:hypothetical protein